MSAKRAEADGPQSTSSARAEELRQRGQPRSDDEATFKHRARNPCFITDYFAAGSSNERQESCGGAEEGPATSDLRARLVEQERRLECQREEVQQLVLSLESVEKRFESYQQGARKALARAVLELECSRLREEFDDLVSRERRLGRAKNPSDPRSFHEWIDGVELMRLKEEQRRLQAEVEDLGAERRSVRGKRTAEDESRSKLRPHLQGLHRRMEEIEREVARLNAEKFELFYRQRRFADNLECSLAAPRPEKGLPAWPCLGNYQFLSLLGRGGFSEVYKAYDLAEFRYVACKVHQLNAKWEQSVRENYLKHTTRENLVFKSLRHPHIVSYFDAVELDRLSVVTVLEYCEGHDLDYLLRKHGTLSEKEARGVIRQVFQALKYLAEQSPRIIHYDVKPQNILFSRANLVKLTDFGLCKLFEGDESRMELTSQGSGTYWYLPPECFEAGAAPPLISPKLDVWSAGVVLFQMLYGRRPFGHSLSQDRIQRERVILRSTTVVFPEKPAVSAEMKDLIRKCLTYEQGARPDAATVLGLLER